jgi:predicted glycosyltransferase
LATILIDLCHPGDVHLFRRAGLAWQNQSHRVMYSSLDRETNAYLLEYYGLPHRIIWRRRAGKLALLAELLLRPWPLLRLIREVKADLVVSFGSMTAAFAAWLLGKPAITLTDTEHATEQHALFRPFSTLIATPDVYRGDFGAKQIRYRGYHELFYLHPDEFTPDWKELEALGLVRAEPFFVVRFVAWGATHDIGAHGLRLDEKRELLLMLSSRGRVLLSVEGGHVEPELRAMVTTFPPEKVHHLLAFAQLYVGEGATMASEAAVLGTPAVYVNTLSMGYVEDEQRYGLLHHFADGRAALSKVRELLATPDLKSQYADLRARLLADKIDPTPWLVDLGNGLLKNRRYTPGVRSQQPGTISRGWR